jgi:hypothetical protein
MMKTTRHPSRGQAYELCRHAHRRAAQRAIGDLQIELIRLFGVDHYQTGGSTLSFIPERTITSLRTALDRCRDVALVKGDDEVVITAMHMHRNIKKTSLAA